MFKSLESRKYTGLLTQNKTYEFQKGKPVPIPINNTVLRLYAIKQIAGRRIILGRTRSALMVGLRR